VKVLVVVVVDKNLRSRQANGNVYYLFGDEQLEAAQFAGSKSKSF